MFKNVSMSKMRNSFASATRIVVVVNRLSGLRPLRYSDTKFWMFLNYFYRMLVIVTMGYVMYWIYMYKLQVVHVKKDRMVYLSTRIFNFFCFLCIQALGYYYSDEIPGLRRRIAVLEESLAKLGADVDNRSTVLWTVGLYATMFLHTLLVLGLLGYWVVPTRIAVYRLFFGFITNIGSQVLLDFLTYVCWLKCSFERTNYLLKQVLGESDRIETGDPSGDVTEDKSDRTNAQKGLNNSIRRVRVAPVNNVEVHVKNVHTVQQIRCIHLHLCGIARTLNKTFDAQITIYMLVLITNFVVILYNVYAELKRFHENPHGLASTAVPMLDILYAYAKVTIGCYLCEDTVKEMKKMVEIVHKSSISDFDVELKNEIYQFSLQLSLNRICDIEVDSFRLSFGYMRQCAGSVTTYLIILIQWDQSTRPDYILGVNGTRGD